MDASTGRAAVLVQPMFVGLGPGGFQAIAVLHDLQVGGGGALKGQGSFG